MHGRKSTIPHLRALAAVLVALPLVGGCGLFDDEDILEGERLPVRAEPAGSVQLQAVRAPLPEPRANAEWTQTNGGPAHNMGHLAGPATLSPAWSRDAGTGGSDAAAITSAPIVAGGAVYVLDAEAQLAAFDADGGAPRWRVSLAPEGESGSEGFGGGLAAEGGRIFATTGFGEVLSLDAKSGEIQWRERFGAPFRAAPAVNQGLVVAVTRDNRALALEAATGKVRWRMQGASSDAGVLGGASPMIAGGLVAVPFGSGELVAVHGGSGRRLWTAVLSGGRKGLARSAITDISGDPVAVGPFVVAANQSGRMLAVDGRSGERAWTLNIGAEAALWPAGGTIFLVSDDVKLMRISARDGQTLWASDLPAYQDPEDREDPISYSAPVLVGGRILLTDSLGNLHSFDATDGVGQVVARFSGGSVTGPVVAGGTVYVLSDDGTLYAYR